jgi:hypothetical protein
MSIHLIVTSALSHLYMYFAGKALLARHIAHVALGHWQQSLKWGALLIGVMAFTSEQIHFWLRMTWMNSIVLASVCLGTTAYVLRRLVP